MTEEIKRGCAEGLHNKNTLLRVWTDPDTGKANADFRCDLCSSVYECRGLYSLDYPNTQITVEHKDDMNFMRFEHHPKPFEAPLHPSTYHPFPLYQKPDGLYDANGVRIVDEHGEVL